VALPCRDSRNPGGAACVVSRRRPCPGTSAASPTLGRPKPRPSPPKPRRQNKFDLDKVPGPWKKANPLLGNCLSLLSPDFHRQFLAWNDE
jgi:hypothetical protein